MIHPYIERSPIIHPTAFVTPDAHIIGDVEIGADSSVWFVSILRGDVNYIRIGARTNIQDQTIIHGSSKDQPTILEDDITVGHRATLHACRVGSNCLIGIGTILLDGVQIGENSLVAAGSLVTPGTIIPPGSLVLGAPAKVKRPLTQAEISDIAESAARYVRLADSYKT